MNPTTMPKGQEVDLVQIIGQQTVRESILQRELQKCAQLNTDAQNHIKTLENIISGGKAENERQAKLIGELEEEVARLTTRNEELESAAKIATGTCNCGEVATKYCNIHGDHVIEAEVHSDDSLRRPPQNERELMAALPVDPDDEAKI